MPVNGVNDLYLPFYLHIYHIIIILTLLLLSHSFYIHYILIYIYTETPLFLDVSKYAMSFDSLDLGWRGSGAGEGLFQGDRHSQAGEELPLPTMPTCLTILDESRQAGSGAGTEQAGVLCSVLCVFQAFGSFLYVCLFLLSCMAWHALCALWPSFPMPATMWVGWRNNQPGCMDSQKGGCVFFSCRPSPNPQHANYSARRALITLWTFTLDLPYPQTDRRACLLIVTTIINLGTRQITCPLTHHICPSHLNRTRTVGLVVDRQCQFCLLTFS